MTPWITVDFESAHAIDLTQVGSARYAEDYGTEVLCLAYQTSDGVAGCWTPGNPIPEAIRLGRIHGWRFVAHNAGFEKDIWRAIMVPVYGWPDIPNEQWWDTMARCANLGVPQKLEHALQALRLSETKDTEGTKITLSLSKPEPRKRSPRYGMLPERTPEIMRRVADYCISDVANEDALLRRVGWLSPEEQRIWQLDQTINERGLRLDVPLIQAMQRIVDGAIPPLAKEFSGLTGLDFTQTVAVRNWVANRGVPLDDLRKETVARLLGDEDEVEDDEIEDEDEGDDEAAHELPDDVRRALSIRQLIGSASIKKLPKMEAMVCHDGRARRLLAYHAAHTGLWGGRLLQPQNFPRGTIREIGVDGKKVSPDIDSLVSALMTGDPEYVEAVYGPPVETVVSSLRHTLVAAPGHVYLAGDYSSIQARLVLALAGEHEITARMAAGFSPYLDMATDIYGRPITKLDVEEYTIGKNTVLGCGFQMGDKTFHRRYCPRQPLSFATTCIKAYREDWAPGVPKVWEALEDAALEAVWTSMPQSAYGMEFKREDMWLTMRLPSGRKLWYLDPRPCRKAMPWSTEENPDVRRAWTFQHGRGRKDMYGGLITQNAISGMARDLLVDAMFKAEAEGLPLVLNVHDQLLCEVEPGRADTKLIDSLMCDVAGWARSMRVPVQADCWAGERFRK